jgi:hypothetical protein
MPALLRSRRPHRTAGRSSVACDAGAATGAIAAVVLSLAAAAAAHAAAGGPPGLQGSAPGGGAEATASDPPAEAGLEVASPTALPDLGWMVGSWAGRVGEDPIEEIWLPAAGGRMVGMFRWSKGAEPYLYELFEIGPHEGGVALLLRHFSPGGLVAWEDEESPMAFRLETAGEGEAVFRHDGEKGTVRIVYRRAGADGLLSILRRPGEPEERALSFEYRRAG